MGIWTKCQQIYSNNFIDLFYCIDHRKFNFLVIKLSTLRKKMSDLFKAPKAPYRHSTIYARSTFKGVTWDLDLVLQKGDWTVSNSILSFSYVVHPIEMYLAVSEVLQ